MSNIEARIRMLSPMFVAPINALQAGDLVACMHLIIDAGEHYAQFDQNGSAQQLAQLNELQSENLQLQNQIDTLKTQLEFANQQQKQQVQNFKDTQNLQNEELSQNFQTIRHFNNTETKDKQVQTEQFFGEIAFGELEDQSDLQHIVYLLLNQNYALSNLLSQQFQSRDHFLFQLFDQQNKQDQKLTLKQLVTALENFSDLLLNAKLLQKSFQAIQICTKSQILQQKTENSQFYEKQKLEFELELLRKKCKIEDMAVQNEELAENKLAAGVVFFKSLSQFYESVLMTGIEEHVRYISEAGDLQKEEVDGSWSEVARILKQLAANQLNFKLVNDSLNQLMQTIPSKIIIKDTEFKAELKRILQQIIMGVGDYKKVINEHQTLLQNVYLLEQNKLLLEVVMKLSCQIESENNTGNLNQFIFVQQNKIRFLMKQNDEQEAKITQLTNINEKMKSKFAESIQVSSQKLNILSMSMDHQKTQKMEDIIVKQQRIITEQQTQIESLYVQKTDAQIQKNDNQLESALLELEKSKIKHSESQNLNAQLVNKYEKLQKEATTKIKDLEQQLTNSKQFFALFAQKLIPQIQQLFNPQNLQIVQKIDAINNKIHFLEQKFTQIQNLLQKYTKLILYQKQIILEKSPFTQAEWCQTQISSFQLSDKPIQTEEKEFRSEESQFQPQQDDKQTQLDCGQCKKCIQLYILEKEEKVGLLAQIEDQDQMKKDYEESKQEAQRLKQQLNEVDKNFVSASKSLIKLKEQLQQCQIEIKTQRDQLQQWEKDDAAWREAEKSYKKQLKNFRNGLENTQKKLNEQDKLYTSQIEAERSKSQKIQNQIQAKAIEIVKYKEILDENTSKQEELKEQLIKQAKTIQKMKRQRVVRDEDRQLMSSILTNEDIDAIFDV